MAGALLVFFFVLWQRGGRARRRLIALTSIAAPLLVVYFAVGWGRPEAIFKPIPSTHQGAIEPDHTRKAGSGGSVALPI